MTRAKRPLGDSIEDRLVVASRYLAAAEAAVQSVIAPWRAASAAEDGQQGIDLVIMPSAGGSAAFRLRRFDNVLRYQDSFTLRTKPHDERSKIQARYYLYAWASPYYQRAEFAAWVLLDVPAMLAAIAGGLPVFQPERSNGDGTSYIAYPLRDDFVLGRQLYQPPAEQQQVAILSTCRYCGGTLTPDLTAHEVAGEIIYRRHREPCYSDEVPG